jgi:assimilatory nitrate reductase catalytic subunit
VRAEVGLGAGRVSGDASHPANLGRLCSKGSALAETLGPEDRLLFPEIGGRRASWDDAVGEVARRFAETIERHGPDSVAFYVSGQFLTEDYYVANKLMKGFVGSGNIDTNSRLCMASTVAGHRRAFGADLVPGCYEDLEEADLVVLVGSNAAWCHPVLFRRLAAARERRGTRLVVIDPRRTATADGADLHLAVAPGTDVALMAGLLAHLDRAGAVDHGFVRGCTTGFEAALERARAACPDAAATARATGLAERDVELFFEWFARTERTVTCWSQGVNQSSRGTDKVNAILNLHLATGRIGRPGMGPLSLTGQPNAMGGREVGGLANQLAAHMDFDEASRDRVARFWGAPNLAPGPGLKAVDLFRAVGEGRVKAVWVMATNPAASMPEADRVAAALRSCEFVAVSDCVRRTDTARLAHVLLPAAGWGEKDGTVTNSERRISRQRAFLAAPGEARPDWWIMTQVARRMGWAEAFPYETPAAIFREHCALTAFENGGTRVLDLGGLAGLDDRAYDDLAPVQWPVPAGGGAAGAGAGGGGTARLFAAGGFQTPDGRARFVAVAPEPPARATDGAFPLALNTGRLRDQWHTMTRTGRSPRLSAHEPEPFVAVAPADAAALGLAGDGFATAETEAGASRLRVRVDAGMRPGTAFVPMHWSRSTAAAGGAGPLAGAATDPVSGQPEMKLTPARLVPWAPGWSGFLVTREPVEPPVPYWARRAAEGCFVHALAGADPAALSAPGLLGAASGSMAEPADEVEEIELHDLARGVRRWARLRGDRIEACLFAAPGGATQPGEWLVGLFGRDAISAEERRWLLSGRAPAGRAEQGPIVCACLGVGRDRIAAAVAGGVETVEGLGAALGAGTNCGSCIPELKELIAHARRQPAA